MGKMTVFFLGVILGGALIFTSHSYHLVRANDGFYLVPKLEASFSHAYVDVREFGMQDWLEHRDVLGAVVKAKKDQILHGSATHELERGLKDAIGSISGE